MPRKYHTKVLVVEDSDMIRDMEMNILSEIGFESVIGVSNGDEAIQALQREKDVGLVICDWNMPVLDGYDFLIWLRSNPQFDKTPFIMATAHGERRQAARALKAGVTRFITKPFSAMELKLIIDRVLNLEEEADQPKERISASGKPILRIAHIQITDHLILGVMKHLAEISPPTHFELETRCMSSWNPVQLSIETGQTDAALVLAPIAMDMFGAGGDIRLLLFAHKNGSVCVRAKMGETQRSLYNFLKGKVIYIPHLLSVHHMLSDMFLKEIGLNPGLVGHDTADVFFEVAPPVMMPKFMARSDTAKGFMVAEPMGAYAIQKGEGDQLYMSGAVWENHPCCVLIVRNEFIAHHEEAVRELVNLLIEAGRHIPDNITASAKIARDFLDPDNEIGLTASLLEKVLSAPKGLKTDDLYPVMEDLDRIQTYMFREMGIGTPVDLARFVDTRFADQFLGEAARPVNPSVFHGISGLREHLENEKQLKAAAPTDEAPPEHQTVFNMVEEKGLIRFEFSSDLRMKDRVIENAAGFVRRLENTDFPEMAAVLNELLTNAILHGNRNDPQKRATCRVRKLHDGLYKIQVGDQGEGFDLDRTLARARDNQLETRRKGLGLVSDMCDQIEFDRHDASVIVYMKLYRKTVYHVEDEGETKVIRPSGDITAASVDELKKNLIDLLEKGHLKYCFDFEHVGDIDSVSLTLFVVFVKMVGKRNLAVDLIIRNCNDNIENLFSMVRLDKYYMII